MTSRGRRRTTLLVLGLLTMAFGLRAAAPSPARVRFAVVGDFGTGTAEQYELANVMDPRFHVDGERYCWFIRSDVEFFALDSNYLDAAQVTWLKQSLAASTDTVDSGNIVR